MSKVVLTGTTLIVRFQCTEEKAITLFKKYPAANKIKENVPVGGTWVRKIFVSQKKLSK
jgi:hypothetical protein